MKPFNVQECFQRPIKFFLLPTFLFCSVAANAKVEMDEFVVDSQLLGQRKLYVSRSVIRIDCARESLTIISKKPFSHVTCFNKSSKRICQADTAIAVKELRTLGVLMAEAGEVTLTWSAVGPETIQGVPCTAYKAKVTHTEAKPNKADEADWRKYWVRKDLEVPKLVGDILSASVGAPHIPGIPQRLEHFGSENDFNIPFLSRSNIDTKKKTLKVVISNKSRKKLSVPDNFFDIPEGYMKRKDFKKVLLHSGGIQSLKDAQISPDFLFETK